MTQQPLYRIEELEYNWMGSNRWKEKFNKRKQREEYQNLVEHEGLNPNRLRVRRDA